jgi:hypothetical protein
MKNDRLFSPDELKEMGRKTSDLIDEAIDSGEFEKAKHLNHRMYAESIAMHDLFTRWVTALLTFIGCQYGDDVLYQAYEETMSVPFKPLWESYSKADNPRKRAEMMAMGLRGHGQDIDIEEDDEKFTFTMRPCGSGGRLVLGGVYEPPLNMLRIQEPQRMTQGKRNLPVYCAHAYFMALWSIRVTGVPYVLEEISDNPGYEPCKIYVYKDPKNIPTEVLSRLGLKDLDKPS